MKKSELKRIIEAEVKKAFESQKSSSDTTTQRNLSDVELLIKNIELDLFNL